MVRFFSTATVLFSIACSASRNPPVTSEPARATENVASEGGGVSARSAPNATADLLARSAPPANSARAPKPSTPPPSTPPPSAAPVDAGPDACPEGMVLVDGDYCTDVENKC